MADIKRGFKRIERVLLVLGVVGAVLVAVFESMSYGEYFILLFLFLSPYLVAKIIGWIVMGFLDDDEVKVEYEVKDDEVKDKKE